MIYLLNCISFTRVIMIRQKSSGRISEHITLHWHSPQLGKLLEKLFSWIIVLMMVVGLCFIGFMGNFTT
jgi:hypothetical protein